jgi:hypothetical protein
MAGGKQKLKVMELCAVVGLGDTICKYKISLSLWLPEIDLG